MHYTFNYIRIQVLNLTEQGPVAHHGEKKNSPEGVFLL